MLKETPRSVRAYFALVAIFWFLGAISGIRVANGNPAILVLSGLSLLLGVLYAYIVYRFMGLLRGNPGQIKNALTAALCYSLIVSLLSFLKGHNPLISFRILIAVAVYLYLTKQVTRLAAEANAELHSPVPPSAPA